MLILSYCAVLFKCRYLNFILFVTCLIFLIIVFFYSVLFIFFLLIGIQRLVRSATPPPPPPYSFFPIRTDLDWWINNPISSLLVCLFCYAVNCTEKVPLRSPYHEKKMDRLRGRANQIWEFKIPARSDALVKINSCYFCCSGFYSLLYL